MTIIPPTKALNFKSETFNICAKIADVDHHSLMCVENSEDEFDALILVKELNDDIDYVIKRYSKCISKSTDNFLDWLTQDYKKRLRTNIRSNFDEIKNKK